MKRTVRTMARHESEQMRNERVEAILAATRGPSVLDIGCSGQANLASSASSASWLHGRLHDQFSDVWGVERSREGVERVRAAGIEKVVQGEAQSFDLGRKFNTVVAGELIEHVENPGLFLDRCRAHLAPAGRIVLTTPYAFFPLFAAVASLKYPRTCQNDEHVAWYCPSTLTTLAHRVGLEVEDLQLVGDFRPDLSSRTGRMVSKVMLSVPTMVPDRLRSNTMLFVLREPSC